MIVLTVVVLAILMIVMVIPISGVFVVVYSSRASAGDRFVVLTIGW